MSFRTRILPVVPFLLCVLGGLSLAPSAVAAATSPVQCAANDDRVWVYDSLTSFTVELRLKCGDQVEIVGRAKGYVKIRTSEGKEGYVPDAALPSLPPYVDPQAIPIEGLASLARSRRAAAAQPQHAVASTNTPSAPPVTAAIPAPVTAKPSVPEATAVMTIEPLPPTSSSAPASAANVKPVSVAPKKTAKPPVVPVAKKPFPPPPPPPANTTTTSASANPPTNTTPRIESAVEKGPVALPTNTSMKQPAAASMRPVAAVSDSEDDPESTPEDQSADPSCRVFFSAYGLAPAQYRWIAQNRQKKYPGVCPASGPSQVDFVMIFTHDVDIFNGTLPDPVHVDKNGFSDFSPLTMVDSALMPEAAADKAHHQLVWVFRIKHGAFEPAKFSPRRHPQFTKTESNSLAGAHAADRTAEDAFQFIEEEGTTR
jgi:hypothetical protein